jgi:hypothetical protein
MPDLAGPCTQGRRLPAVARPALLAGAGVLVVIGAITVAALNGPGAGQPTAAHVALSAPPAPPVQPAPRAPAAPEAPRTLEPQPDVPVLFDREAVERALVGIERVLTDERVAARVDDVRALGAQLTDEEELRVLVDLARERLAVAAEELPVAIGRFEQWLAERAADGQG